MDIAITFPGGKRVDAEFDGRLLRTDQPPELGGDGEAPAPFDLFLASLATCAGLYVLGFLQARGLATDGVRLVQHNRFEPLTHRLEAVDLEVFLPESFPEKYRAAVVRAAEGCKVKNVLAAPPEITVHVTVGAEDAGNGRQGSLLRRRA
jgi:ribosomal protein S12 methylthiotransferase accessory factor